MQIVLPHITALILNIRRSCQEPIRRGVKIPAMIEKFKREHYEIVKALAEIKEFGVLTKDGNDKLMSVKETLHEHLKEEDEKLYLYFHKAAEQNKKLRELLELFAEDLETVSRNVTEFFDKYSKGALDTVFMEEFENLYAAFYERMVYEEYRLFDEFEELNKL
jgi:hypothetical protein